MRFGGRTMIAMVSITLPLIELLLIALLLIAVLGPAGGTTLAPSPSNGSRITAEGNQLATGH
jgi:hypothetical protein